MKLLLFSWSRSYPLTFSRARACARAFTVTRAGGLAPQAHEHADCAHAARPRPADAATFKPGLQQASAAFCAHSLQFTLTSCSSSLFLCFGEGFGRFDLLLAILLVRLLSSFLSFLLDLAGPSDTAALKPGLQLAWYASTFFFGFSRYILFFGGVRTCVHRFVWHFSVLFFLSSFCLVWTW